MSHYTELKTEFKSVESLVSALVDMGIPADWIEVHAEPQQIFRYNHQPSKYRWEQLQDERFKEGDKCNVIIRRNNVGRLCNDLGFHIDPEKGESVAFACDYSKRASSVYNAKARECGGYNETWMGQLSQQYAKHETLRHHEEMGDYTEVVEGEEGEIYVYASL